MDLDKPREIPQEVQNHCIGIIVQELAYRLSDLLNNYLAGDHGAKVNGMLNVVANVTANAVVSQAKDGLELECLQDVCNQIMSIGKQVLEAKQTELAQLKKETH